MAKTTGILNYGARTPYSFCNMLQSGNFEKALRMDGQGKAKGERRRLQKGVKPRDRPYDAGRGHVATGPHAPVCDFDGQRTPAAAVLHAVV